MKTPAIRIKPGLWYLNRSRFSLVFGAFFAQNLVQLTFNPKFKQNDDEFPYLKPLELIESRG